MIARTYTLPAALLLFCIPLVHAEAQNSTFVQTNLVANLASYNPQIVDPNMLDAWGIALRPPGAGGHIWIDNAEYGTSDEFIGDVNGIPLHQDGLTSVPLDTPRFTDHGYAFVTGIVYNSASDLSGQAVEFPLRNQPAQNDNNNPPTSIPGGYTGPAKFVFVTEDGCINAWSQNTATAMPTAPIIVDYSKEGNFPARDYANAVFSGVAMSENPSSSAAYTAQGGNHIFVADFRNNAINVFDDQWNDVTSSYTFQIPATVGNFHVFNITDIGGNLYAAYAQFNAAGDEGMEEMDGAGYGHIVEYSETGALVRDFNDAGDLNAPWGMIIAPSTFGTYAGDLLVANFGDGSIAAFDPSTGNFIGYLSDPNGNRINIDGIWGLTFGNGVSLGNANSLYFTAGPNSERDGVFGRLDVYTPPVPVPPLVPAVAFLVFVLAGIVGILHLRRCSQANYARQAALL